nr:hypothetical protein [uncultured Flavobacterium sp.]
MLNTRDLLEKREELKQDILDSFHEDFENYVEQTESYEDILFEEEEIQSWLDDWKDEREEIEAINSLENEVGSEFEYGVILIPEDDFEEYCEELLKDCGDLPQNIPSYIEIDWSKTADNLKVDYSEVDFQGTTYLFS